MIHQIFGNQTVQQFKLRQDGVCQRRGDKIVHLEKIFNGYLEKGYIQKLRKEVTIEEAVTKTPTLIKFGSSQIRKKSKIRKRAIWGRS